MGRTKAVRPAPAPRPIAPVTAESEGSQMAADFTRRELQRKRGRKSTLLVPASERQANMNTLIGSKTTLG